MSIVFECPSCGKRTQAPDELAGKKARCPKCQTVIQVPSSGSAEGAPAAAEAAPAAAPVAASPAEQGEAESRRPCPMCGEMILSSAVKCRYCGEVFDPELRRAERKRRGAVGDADLTAAEWLIAILCSGIGCIIGIIWMIQGKPKGTKMFGVSFLMAIVWSAIRVAIELAVEHGR